MDDRSTRIRRALVQQLESLQAAGVGQVPRPLAAEAASPSAPERAPAAAPDTKAAPEPSRAPETTATPKAAAATPAGRTLTAKQASALLDEVRVEVAACRLCEELACSRKQTVFGVGNPAPRLCFFGEAPGADEDRQGEPFVGPAGQLLNDIIHKAMGLRREDVYILNTLKCRPPGNRNPEPRELENCRPFFERQLEILQPEFICCLGAIAARTLLDTDVSVGRLRGRFHQYNDAQVVVTYHPAYLLRTPEAKKKTWEDIKLLMGQMGLKVK